MQRGLPMRCQVSNWHMWWQQLLSPYQPTQQTVAHQEQAELLTVSQLHFQPLLHHLHLEQQKQQQEGQQTRRQQQRQKQEQRRLLRLL